MFSLFSGYSEVEVIFVSEYPEIIRNSLGGSGIYTNVTIR